MITATLEEIKPFLNATLSGKNVQFTGCSTDSRQSMKGQLFIALKGDNFDAHQFIDQAKQQGAVALIVEQDVTTDLPILKVENTRQALGDLARFWRQKLAIPCIALTGSNGKTTTKEMLKSILSQQGNVLATKGNLNNEIGVPLTLFNLNKNHDYAIIEMGANHVGEIAYLTDLVKPDVALITQCAPAHLEGFGSIDNVAKAKGEIFSGLSAQGIAVINQDDNYADFWQTLASSRQILTFGLDNQAAVTAKNINYSPTKSTFTLYHKQDENIDIELFVAGQHNIMNALAASSCALAIGCDLVTIQKGLQNFSAVKGRLHPYPAIHNSIVIDDTYNANPTSLQAALNVLQQYATPRWLVLGDMGELGEKTVHFHQQVAQLAQQAGIIQLWTVGKFSQHATTHFGQGATHFATHDALVQALKTALLKQDNAVAILVKGSRSMHMETIVNALQVEK